MTESEAFEIAKLLAGNNADPGGIASDFRIILKAEAEIAELRKDYTLNDMARAIAQWSGDDVSGKPDAYIEARFHGEFGDGLRVLKELQDTATSRTAHRPATKARRRRPK